jgi:aminoglycoside phosphotransferase (APT) family kinase protein
MDLFSTRKVSRGALASYDAETRQAISILQNKVDADAATEVWERALKTTWQRSPVWVHGDISSGNLLVQEGKLSAVIDFGDSFSSTFPLGTCQ